MISYISEEFSNVFLHRSIRVSVAESITCGSIQNILGKKSGASRYFEGGITVYSLEQKVRILGVSREEADKTNCVSKIVSEEMALGVRRLFHSDVSVSTTGYAEPDFSANIMNPFAHVAVCIGEEVYHKHIEIPDIEGRLNVQSFVSDKAIELLVDKITEEIKI